MAQARRGALTLAALTIALIATALHTGAARRTPGKAISALQRPWPAIVTRPDNLTTPAKVALGRLLFYDPILSNDNATSCAHCHHPDLGFSDGLARARGYGGEGAGNRRVDGVELNRRTPTLWNTAYNRRQYWDGRAADLEEQAKFPIHEQDEMNQDPRTLEAELKTLPEYRRLFDKAFGGKDGSEITFDNVCRALAVFQRTLISRNSPFDRYAAGNASALTPAQQRGLKLFSSEKAKCAQCHTLPTFASAEFKVTGVPDLPGKPPDKHRETAMPGRGGGPNSAFKVPTLRNAALKPPYMHNGSLKTLGEVIDFYAKGGGRGRGVDVPLQDPRIRPFRITGQEKADLIAFLHALTDVSAMSEVPKSVPSDLEVVPRLKPAVAGGRPATARRSAKPS